MVLRGSRMDQHPQLLLVRGTSGDTEGCASPLAPSHLGTLWSPTSIRGAGCTGKAGQS